jgi:hypothetical protein
VFTLAALLYPEGQACRELSAEYLVTKKKETAKGRNGETASAFGLCRPFSNSPIRPFADSRNHGLGLGVGRTLGVGTDLGVGVGLGVVVGVAVGVAVAVGVGVAVGVAVAVGLGVALPQGTADGPGVGCGQGGLGQTRT